MSVDTADDIIAPLWKEAFAEYEKDTKRPLSPQLLEAMRGVQSSEDLLRHIEEQGQAFRSFRSKRTKLWGILHNFVSPLAAILQIALTPSSVSDGVGVPSSAVIGACLYLVKSCERVTEAYDWIEQVFNELQEFSDRLNIYTQGSIDTILEKKIVVILSFMLRIIGRSESLIKEKRFREYLRVTFLGKDEKTKKLLEDLNKLFIGEGQLINALMYASNRRIEEKLDKQSLSIGNEKSTEMLSISNGGTESGTQTNERIQRTLVGTSAAEDVQEIFYKNSRTLLKGTGDWLRGEEHFASWVERRTDILWIWGGPGAGKSHLATSIILQLQESQETERGTLASPTVAYFFVKENNELLRDANTILKTLAKQLVDQDSRLRKHVAQISKDRSNTITAEDTWETIFLGYYGNPDMKPRSASIVIDGLDEATADTRRTFLGFMKDVVGITRSATRPVLQFAIIGRASLRDDIDFTGFDRMHLIEISKHKNREDIDNYIRKRLREVEVLQELRKIEPHGRTIAKKRAAAIRSKILRGADGVFLWAKLLIDTILRRELAEIDVILKEPPRDLDGMIRSVFDRLANDNELDHHILRKMLLCCGYARRPLNFGELDTFLSLPSMRPNLLLWKQVRGKLSSVFELDFPADFDPDAIPTQEVQDTNDLVSNDGTVVEDVGSDDGFSDFSSNAGSDTEEFWSNVQDEDGIESPIADRGLQSKPQNHVHDSTGNAIRHLSNGQLKTEITFYHTRIKDYIVREGDPKTRQMPMSPIVPPSNSVQVQMIINCLDVLRLEYSLQPGKRYLVEYPVRYLAVHLGDFDVTQASDDEFIRVVEGLHWLFGTERGTECFIRATQVYDVYRITPTEFHFTWVGSDKALRLVQNWFKNAERRTLDGTKLGDVELSWIRAAGESFADLLRPLMMAASKIWLTKRGYDSEEYTDKQDLTTWLLRGWLSLVKDGAISPEIQAFDFDRDGTKFHLLSAEHIKTIGTWADLPHDTHWYSAIGRILLKGEFYKEAKHHFQEAIAQDPKAWAAFAGIGQIHGHQSEYQLAIDNLLQAIEIIPHNLAIMKGDLYPRLSLYYSKLENNELAHDAAQKGFEADPSDLDAQWRYFKVLYWRSDWSGIMTAISALNKTKAEDMSGTLLTQLLTIYDVYTEIGQACRQNGQPSWIFAVMDEALKKVDNERQGRVKTAVLSKMTEFNYYWYDHRRDQTIRYGEMYMEQPGVSMDNPQKKWVISKLAQLYFDKATALFRAANSAITPEVSALANKLKALAVSVLTGLSETYEGFEFFRQDYAALLWGRWLRDYQKADEKLWRKCFKGRLLEQMKALDDDDPSNDAFGMVSLADTLFHAGDRENAATILAILFQLLEDAIAKEERGDTEASEEDHPSKDTKSHPEPGKEHTETPDQQDAENRKPENEPNEENVTPPPSPEVTRTLTLSVQADSLVFSCDNCRRKTRDVEEFFYCEVCLDVHWCGECLVMVKDRSLKPGLKWNLCNPDHDFYRAWPIPEDAKALAVEYQNGDLGLKREWLEGLRREWLR
ncbi:hypothetical protein CC80DRAFT_452308 [Byssothecium circinans]|uniref:Uncharacterized protein n=1 Tax=Byssothecium circinans TaxID=147558 RepID=A0A6A5TLA4_9PLEO|nr:hypothetical protein CC80DRAFT_452308 [Byssothecium circinans]